jgi:hypothetical protein
LYLQLQRRAPSRGDDKNQAHVIIKYHVKPSAHKQFLDAWSEAEKGTGAQKMHTEVEFGQEGLEEPA